METKPEIKTTEATVTVEPPEPKRKYTRKPTHEKSLTALNKELREKNTLLENKVKELTVLCERFKSQYNAADNAYQNLKAQVNGRETFLKTLITTAAESAMRMEALRG